MADVKENSVSRHNQLSGYPSTFFLGNPSSKTRILIFGNSITLHPIKEELGWFHHWGMAASDISKDYVHVLFNKLTESLGYEPYILVSQVADAESQLYEYQYSELDEEQDFNPNIIVFRLGDNVFPIESDDVLFDMYDSLLKQANKNNPKVIVTGSYFVNKPIEPVIIKYAKKHNFTYLKLDDISLDEANWGGKDKFSHPGVAMHPGDKGMEIIAERIKEVIVK